MPRVPDIALWRAIENELDRALPRWHEMIDGFGQVAAVNRRTAGTSWTDYEVFEALLCAVLTNSTDYAKVQAVLPDLRLRFSNFNLSAYAKLTNDEVEREYVSWFLARRAGSLTLKRSLLSLIATAGILQRWSETHSCAEHYFLEVIRSSGGDVKRAAVALGAYASPKKLPGLGVPIAAESLRNMGFDLCKPDRHLCRAAGSFGLVEFRRWPNRDGTAAPQANSEEMWLTMAAVETLASTAGRRVTYVDTAIWLLCARMGLYMSNSRLAHLASRAA